MNFRNPSAFTAFILLATWGIFAPLRSYSQDASEVIFTLGGQPVEKDELVYLLSKGQITGTSGVSREEFEENLELFINFKLKVKEAESLGLDQGEEFEREFESFKESLIAPFLIKNSLEEGELRKAYARMQEIVRASHVLLQFPPNASSEDSLIVLKMALKIKSEIENGGNINELALQYSDDPSAKTNKGDLGYFTSLQMVQPFEDAAFMLQSGQVSDPVLTNYGYHIIQVRDRKANPGQVRVSHILVRFDPMDSVQELNARRKISDIYTEIQKESTIWEEIVNNFSEDLGTKENGGLLPWFGVGNMIPEFEMAAFSLTEIGEVSPPIRTQYGYHILRLEGKRPIESFEEMEESIRSRILRDSRSKMIQSQVEAIQKARYGFEEQEATVAELANTLNSVPKSQFADIAAQRNWTKTPLFTLSGKTYDFSRFLDFVQNQELIIRGSAGAFDFWYGKFVSESLSTTEEQDLEKNNKEYKMLLKEYRDGILLFSLMNQEVWQRGISDSLGQVEFFRKNIENYQWNNRVQAYIIRVLDKTQLESSRKMLENSGYNPLVIENFESQLKANHPLAFQTESGIIEYETHPVLSKADLSKSYQEIQIDGNSFQILLGEKYPAGPRKFEESRGLVIRDYQEYLDQNLTSTLKRKYPVQVNANVKEEAFLSINR